MYKKKLFIISILMLFIMCIGVVSASDNIDEVSNSSAQDIDSPTQDHDLDEDILSISHDMDEKSAKLNVTGETFGDIENTIRNASDYDTIELTGTYKGSGKAIIIDRSITLDGGKGATLNANKKSSVIKIIDGNVVLKNINFVNGKNDAIFNFGNKCTVINCSFKKANIDSRSEISIINSTFKPSLLSIRSEAKLHMFNSTFDGIFGEEYVLRLYGDSVIDLCTFKNIESRDYYEFYGGLIANSGNLKIRNSHFINNTFDIGITNGKSLKISNTDFLKNNGYILIETESKLSIESSKIMNNKMRYAPIYSKNSNITLNKTTFKSNTNMQSNIFLDSNTNSKVNIIDCTFDSCKNTNRGAIFLADTYTKLYITNKGKTQKYTNVCVIDGSFNKKNLCYCKANKLKTSYKSGSLFGVDSYYCNNNKPFEVNYDDMDEYGYSIFDSDCSIVLKVFTGKKSKTYKLNADYITALDLSTLSVGTHKVNVFYYYNGYKVCGITSSVQITKAKTIVKAPKVTAKKGKSKYFKITLKHKNTKKALAKIKVKAKVYTGKKYKTYTLKTNKKGIAQLNTKKLKRGYHKVIIQSGNKNYIISAKSSIKIK